MNPEVYWLVLDPKDGTVEYGVEDHDLAADCCHEQIKDALDLKIAEARRWVVRKFIAADTADQLLKAKTDMIEALTEKVAASEAVVEAAKEVIAARDSRIKAQEDALKALIEVPIFDVNNLELERALDAAITLIDYRFRPIGPTTSP